MIVQLAKEAAEHLREEADFNRSWIDGRKHVDPKGNLVRDFDGYVERRKEVAEQRESWANAIDELIAKFQKQP